MGGHDVATMVTSLRLPDELRERIDALAKATGRNKSYLLTEAISRYVDEEAWQIAAVEEGIRSAETEPLTAQDDLVDDLLRRGLVTEDSLVEARRRLAGS